MRMMLDEESLNSAQPTMILEHNGRKIHWIMSSYIRDKSGFLKYDMCEHINGYWSTLPAYRQEKIFNIYLQIREIFEEVYTATGLITELMPKVKDLYDEHPLSEISYWSNFHSNIIYPDDPKKFPDEYIQSDERPGSREKTYLKQEYKDLVTLAIALRIMIPIWGEFIYRTHKETGTDFKEYYAFQLLDQSYILRSQPMEKLSTYVIHNIQADRPIGNIVMKGVGTEDFPLWLLAMVVVRRLCIGDIRGVNTETNLVTFIYNFIDQKVAGNNSGNYATMVKVKEFESATSSDDHNASRLEGYKIKLKASIGDLAIYEHYMDHPYQVAQKLKPDVNLDLLTEFLQTSQVLQNELVQVPQVTIAQYVLKPVVSPRALTHLNKLQVMNAVAISQTLLWENGHHVIAGLMTAIATDNETEMMISSMDSRARIPKELNERIQQLFPYTKIPASRKKTKVHNPVILAIDELAKHLGQRDWLLTMHPDKIRHITGHENISRFSCPHDIKILLAKLVIQLAESR